jgi:tetratricopeptide (TPR) repeat protein
MKRSARFIAVLLLLSLIFPEDSGAVSRKALLAEKLYLQGNYQSAAYECERLFRENNVMNFKCEVAHLAALSYLKLGDHDKAKRYFEFVTNNSGDAELAGEAETCLSYIALKAKVAAEPSYYAVQVGSFKNKKNAVRLFNRFKRRKYTVRITEDKDGVVTIYKVKIGRFKTKDGAVRFSKKLRKLGYQTAIVAY